MKPTANWMLPEQFNRLLDAVPSLGIRKWKDEDIVMLFKICYWLALRIGEGIKVKAEDFDLELKYLHLGKTKTDKMDKRIIPTVFIPELEVYLTGKTGQLFPELKYDNVYGWLIKLGKKLNIEALTKSQSETGEKTKTHIFRKSRGKDMFFGSRTGHKADIGSISDRLGHKGKNRFAMTMEYLKLGNEGVRNYDDEEARILDADQE